MESEANGKRPPRRWRWICQPTSRIPRPTKEPAPAWRYESQWPSGVHGRSSASTRLTHLIPG